MKTASPSRKNNTRCQKEKCGGFTLFELAVCLIVMGILSAVLYSRVVMYQQEADRAGAEKLVGILRAALNMRIAGAVVAHREHELLKIAEENPINWLVEKPKNYLGEYYSPEINTLPKGYWYFDRRDKTLVYLLNKGKSFAEGSPNLLKFKVKFPGDLKNQALPAKPTSELQSIALEEVFAQDAVR
jgi:prepilin-type N-terminal cleavage/methylation domain-containing protein